jgi:urease accessory protein
MHPAKISIDLNLDKAATLHWLPQETIIFQGAAVDRTINLNMSADSSCLIAETIILGRQAMGEKIEKCYFTDNWRLYKDGILFHAESLRISDDVEALINANAGINGARMISTIICVGANTEYLKPIIENNLASENSICAATYLNEKLIVRLVSNYSAGGRTDLNKILCALRGHPMPRVWQT